MILSFYCGPCDTRHDIDINVGEAPLTLPRCPKCGGALVEAVIDPVAQRVIRDSLRAPLIPAMLTSGEPMLITTDDWFWGPDGEQYRVVRGRTRIVLAQDILGIKPYNSANWFAVVEDQLIIAGCRIHYVVRSINTPLKTGEDGRCSILDLTEGTK